MGGEIVTADPQGIVRAQRTVSVRDLARGAGKMIDEIELNRSAFVLSRYGRMVALICPLPERTVVEITGPPEPGARAEEEAPTEEPDRWRHFDDVQKLLLARGLDAYPKSFSLEGTGFDASKVAVAFSNLELAGLADLERGRRLTQLGYEAARWVGARVDSSTGAASS
jgi:hypothetical protein